MKRRPTLADLVLAQSPLGSSLIAASWRNQALDWLRVSKRFVLDESAAVYLGRMVRESPRVIADAQDFAIPPYSQMWVEIPYRSYFSEVTADGGRGLLNPEEAIADQRLGYLFNGPSVRVFAEDNSGSVGVLPVQYALHHPLSVEEQIELAESLGISRVGLDLWFWGSSARHYRGALCDNADDDAHEWDRAGMRALRDNHGAKLAPLLTTWSNMKNIAQSSAGDLRTIVALLLFLNRTADITIADEVPRAEGFISRKLRPFLSHRVIKLKLDPMPRLRRLSAGLGIKRRLHDVRGHFCHDRRSREGCPHGEEHAGDFGEWWEEYDVLRWRCTTCGGKRWWRHEHKRGEPKIGEVAQTYEVTQ